jgi:hypothetical protein
MQCTQRQEFFEKVLQILLWYIQNLKENREKIIEHRGGLCNFVFSEILTTICKGFSSQVSSGCG